MSGEQRRRRLLIYGMNYAPEVAGVGKYTGEIGDYFVDQGWEVSVITSPPHYPSWAVGSGYRNAWSKELLGGAHIYRCPLYLHSEMRGLRRLLAPLSFAISSLPVALWRALTWRPNVILAIEPTLFVTPAALLAAGLAGARTALHVQDLEIDAALATGHLSTDGGWLERLAFSVERQVLRRFHRVITIANAMGTRLIGKGVEPQRLEIVRNWVDLETVKPTNDQTAYRAELGISAQDFVVLYSGSIGAKQGVRMLIEAAGMLADEERVIFVIAGEGPMRKEVERVATVLKNIVVAEFQPIERFSDFLGIADVHVMPQEAGAADLMLPSKVGAMLASGRPILATAVHGTELGDFLGDTCRLISPGNVEELCMALREMAKSPDVDENKVRRLEIAESLSKPHLISSLYGMISGA